MRDIEEAKAILRIEVSRDRQTQRLFINQYEYSRNILERFGMSQSKPVIKPIVCLYDEGTSNDSVPADNVP